MEKEFVYKDLLKKAVDSLPKTMETKDRFSLPDISVVQQGNKTLLKNFGDILAVVRRDPKHMSKYLFKELATRGSVQNNVLTLDTKASKETLKSKIESYVQEFVQCRVCHEPDTKIMKEGRLTLLVCDACGAKSPVKIL